MRRLLALFLFAPSVWAACTGSSPTWTTTPDEASVNTCLTNASRNDTVNVSAGSATWSTGNLCPDGVTTAALCITKGVKLVGAGPANNSTTVITNGLGSSAVLISVGPDTTSIANSDTIRIENFTFDANGGIFRVISITGAPYNNTKPYKNFLITGNLFRNSSCNNDTGVVVGSQARGVIWKNTFDRWEYPFRSFGSGDQRTWQNSAYYPFSYGSADNVYFETNTIHNTSTFSCNGGGWMESGQDGRWVVRFNTWDETNNAAATDFQDSHGAQNYYNGGAGTPNGQTSTMVTEWYRNTYTTPNAYFRWALIRGSWNFFFDNTITSPGTPYIDVLQYAVPPDSTAGCYNYLQNFDNTPWTGPDMTLQNSYIINNLTNGVLTGAFAHTGDVGGHNNNCGVVENGAISPYGTGVLYGFWNQNNSFNGTVGVGRGVLASKPATCTTGVGYWATDQGSWNNGGIGGQGVFYKCTATNTWTLYYTPLAYPNPLVATGPIATFTPASVNVGQVPSGLTSNPITVTLQNTGNANLVVSNISLGAAVFSLINNTCGSPATITNGIPGTGFTLAPNATCTFNVIYQPAVPNFVNTAFVAFSDNAGNPDNFNLSGTSTGPPAPAPVMFAGKVATHTLCKPLPVTTQLCFASDCNCWWVSMNGGSYIPLGVSSVNGKTGVVTLGIQ